MYPQLLAKNLRSWPRRLGLVLQKSKRRTPEKAIFSDASLRSMSGGGSSFVYPQARRDETVVDDYHDTKVNIIPSLL